MAYFEKNIKLNEEQKGNLIGQVTEVFEFYRTQLEQTRQRQLEIFENTFIFKFDRGNGRTSLCFPKLYEHLQRIAPRLVANEPKWVITPLVMSRDGVPTGESEDGTLSFDQQQSLSEEQDTIFKEAEKSQLYLNYIWNLGRCQEKLDSWSVNGLVQNIGWAKVDFVSRKRKRKIDLPNGETKEVEEIYMEYPTFDVVDPLAMYFDPKIEFIEDMRSVIYNQENVSTADLRENKELYYKEALEWLKLTGDGQQIIDSKQTQKFTAQGIPANNNTVNLTCNIKEYVGYVRINEDDEDEVMVELLVANDTVVLSCKEIAFNPYEKWSPSKVPNQAVGVGALSPILDLHKAYNLTRNQRFDNVSLVINRMWMLKRGSGVDPKKLRSLPGNVIDVDSFDSVAPLQTPDVTGSSFDEAQSLSTEMQTATGTIDATQDGSGNGFTNLATGQKIRYAEFSARFKYYKANLERSLAKLGQKMLMMTAHRAKQNPVILDKATSQFYRISKDVFDSFDDFFEVSVLADSTSYDSIYNARDEALAQADISLKYQQVGVPVDLNQSFLNIMKTFPGTDAKSLLLPPQPPQQAMEAGADGGEFSQAQINNAMPPMSSEQQLSNSITGNV